MRAPIRFKIITATLLAVAIFSGPVAADTDESQNGEPAPQVDSSLAQKLRSPRATMRTFLTAMNDGRIDDAIDCLDLSGKSTASVKKAVWVYDLKQIIDRMWKITYDPIPDEEEFAGEYNLAEQAPSGTPPEDKADARLIVIARSPDGLWRFSPKTVALIEEIWGRWRNRKLVVESNIKVPFSEQLRNMFPEYLLEQHFLLPDYQWLCLLALVFLGFVADLITRLLLHYATSTWFKYMKQEEQAQNERKAWRPMGLLMQALVWYGGTTLIGLPDFALQVLLVALKFFTVVAGVWTAFRLIDLLAGYLAKKALATDTKFDDLLVPLVSRSLKIFVVCVGVLTCAQAFDLPIAGLLGGLGIGGMALAFAAKDAVANVFGSITVLVDRPFEIGDWIVTDGVEGTVEAVGFRSTRVRTFYNSQVTVPNSRLTTATVDNMGRRSFRRVKATLGVQYDTKPEQIDAFCEGIREIVRRHPYTRKDYYHVYFNGFSNSSLDILLYCFMDCSDWAIELREKHRLFLDIVRLAHELGVSFAFPTQTLHMFQEQHGTGELPVDLSNPDQAGQRLAAKIAGPLLSATDRPGGVDFSGPTPIGGDE